MENEIIRGFDIEVEEEKSDSIVFKTKSRKVNRKGKYDDTSKVTLHYFDDEDFSELKKHEEEIAEKILKRKRGNFSKLAKTIYEFVGSK